MRISICFLFLLLLFSCSTNNSESEAEIMKNFANIPTGLPKDKASLLKKGQLLISIPKNANPEMPVLLVFGGMYYATPEFMLKNTPQELFDKGIIAYAPCRYEGGKGFTATKKELTNQLKKQGISITKLVVCGFSGGGPDALEAEGEDLTLVGLIDAEPLLPKKKNAKYPELIVSFNKYNWNDNEYYGEKHGYKHFKTFASWTKKQGGTVEENKVKHEWFPKYFLYKYRRKLFNA